MLFKFRCNIHCLLTTFRFNPLFELRLIGDALDDSLNMTKQRLCNSYKIK